MQALVSMRRIIQVWMSERAKQVRQALQEAASRRPLTSQEGQVAQLLVKLCDTWLLEMLPFGVVLGWIFQTGCAIEKHDYVDTSGKLEVYAMPALEEGEKRVNQLSRICNEGGDP